MAKKYDKLVVEALVSGETLDRPGFAEAAVWLADGTGDLGTIEEQVALSAIEAATRGQAIDRLQSLERSKKALKKAARVGLHKLKSAGVTVAPVRSAARFTLGVEAVEHWSTAWLSPPDPEGYAQVFLFWSDADLVGFYLCLGGGGQGIREDETTLYPSTRSRLRKLQKDFQADPIMREIPFTTGLNLAQAAFKDYQTLTGKVPMDWADFLANVPEPTKLAAQLLNPIAGFPAEVDLEALQQFENLQRLTGIDWPVKFEALSEVGIELMTFMNSDLEISEEIREERMKGIEAKAGEAGLTDEVRVSVGRRLRQLAIYAAAGGQADFASEAWNHHLAVTTGVPAADMPYFCWVCVGNLLTALQSMMGLPDESVGLPGFPGGSMGAPALADHGHAHSHDHSHVHGPDCDH